MKSIDLFERAITEQAESLSDYGINETMFWAYQKSMEAENALINFYEVIWDEDVEPIDATFRQNGITEFTISSTSSSLIATLAAFEKQDFRVAGLTQVNTSTPIGKPA